MRARSRDSAIHSFKLRVPPAVTTDPMNAPVFKQCCMRAAVLFSKGVSMAAGTVWPHTVAEYVLRLHMLVG